MTNVPISGPGNFFGGDAWARRGESDGRVQSLETSRTADEAKLALINTAGWPVWVPTWTNLTVGAGATTSYRYSQQGKDVTFRMSVTLGTGPSVGTDPHFTLPVAATGYNIEWPIGKLVMVDAGVKAYSGHVQIWSNTEGLIRGDDGAGAFTSVAAAFPFAWSAGDYFMLTATYEAA